MPYTQPELNAAARPADTAARLAARNARAARLRARALKMGYEPADYATIEDSVLAEAMRAELLNPASRFLETGNDLATPATFTP